MQPYDVFLSFTWSDVGEVSKLEHALLAAGLTVFRDSKGIRAFEGITEELEAALASCKVLLAYYSHRFPTRYACQWELTSAYLAAQAIADPRQRVLVVNPESDGNHVAPVQLQDAAYFGKPRDDKHRAEIAARVAEMVRAAGVPLGAARSTAPLLPRLLRPRRFVGRYKELWQIHSALHARDLPPSTPPTSSALTVVRGLAGLGKTSLAEQYAFLFRDAFPGGVHWLGPVGQDSSQDPLALFRANVRSIARDAGLNVRGLEHGEIRNQLAKRVTANGKSVLWVVDDVASGLPVEVLNQLVMPTPFIRTVMTTRTGTPAWQAPTIELGGLSAEEGAALYAETLAPADHLEHAAVRRLVHRCGGHPMVLTSTANALRARRGAIDTEDFVTVLDSAKADVVDILREDVERCSRTARRILQLAAALSRAPFPPELVRKVFGGEQISDAIAELTDHGLLWHPEPDWDVHALVRDVVKADAELTRRAATIALDLLSNNRTSTMHQHAAALAAHSSVPAADRSRLLRAGLDWFRDQGDVLAARAAAERIVENPESPVADRVAAAGALIESGEYQRAAEVCHPHLAPGDVKDAFLARLTCARALDHQGLYAPADALWPERAPGWMTDPELTRTTGYIAVAHRMRGRFRKALELLEPLPPDPRVRLEQARLQIITGQIKQARKVTAAIIDEYAEPGLEGHPLRLEAIGLQAEAQLTLDLTELKVPDEEWDRVEQEMLAARDNLARLLGKDNPLTISADVRCARASVSRGRPERALRELSTLEPSVARAFGERHPLFHWLRYSMAQAHAQLKQYDRVVSLLEVLLRSQLETLGSYHPDTMMTQLDLGIALALTGRKADGEPLVAEAEERIGDVLGWRADLRTRAAVTKLLMNLPPFVWRIFPHVDELFGKKKQE